MPKVSVIVPVYNVEKYITECIDSIIAQTLKDIEIICVDDGSTDKSAVILDSYAKKDGRIMVVHRQNAGYGAAMNAGLSLATGEYIGIVESDDCILPQMYETLYDCAKMNKLDIVKADAFYWLQFCDYRKCTHRKRLDGYYNRVLGLKERRIFFDFYMNTWTGIYRKEFIDEFKIRYNETPGASYQDNGFWIQTLAFCKNAMWIDKAFYLYRQDNPAASIKSKDKIYAMSNEYDYLKKKLETMNASKEIINICDYYRMVRNKGTFMRIADEHKRVFCNKVIEDYNKYENLIDDNIGLKLWYDNIKKDPDSFCGEFVANKKRIYDALCVSGHIVIYGFGEYGQHIFRHLVNMGFYHKVSCFMSSEKSEICEIAGIPVKSIAEYTGLNNETIIIGVSENSKAYTEIAMLLRSIGINKWLKSSDIMQYFYLV